jgi:hypothetical protein
LKNKTVVSNPTTDKALSQLIPFTSNTLTAILILSTNLLYGLQNGKHQYSASISCLRLKRHMRHGKSHTTAQLASSSAAQEILSSTQKFVTLSKKASDTILH